MSFAFGGVTTATVPVTTGGGPQLRDREGVVESRLRVFRGRNSAPYLQGDAGEVRGRG